MSFFHHKMSLATTILQKKCFTELIVVVTRNAKSIPPIAFDAIKQELSKANNKVQSKSRSFKGWRNLRRNFVTHTTRTMKCLENINK